MRSSIKKKKKVRKPTELSGTDRELAAIRLERDRLLSILENVPAIADVVDMDTYEVLYMNKYTRNLYGEDSVGKVCHKVFHGYDSPCAFCTNDHVRKHPSVPYRWEYHSERLNRDFMATNVVIPWPDGRKVKFEFSVDITERRSAERIMQRMSTAVRDAAEVIVLTKPDGIIEYVNPAFERMSGFTAAEVVGQHIRVLKSGVHDKAFYENLWTVLKRGATWRGQFINRKKDGTRYIESASISPVIDSRGQVMSYVAVKRDITHEQQLENQIREAQKMAALGQLSNRMAHDFTNILVAILGNAELAKRSAGDPAVTSCMEQIIAAVRRMSSFTSQLLSFAHPSPPNSQITSIDNVVRSIGEMIRRTAGPTIQLSIDASSGCRAMLDAAQIEQVLVNMSINSMEAMPDGGRIDIRVCREQVSPDAVHTAMLRSRTKPASSYAVISVTDTGRGMSPETLTRVFEPFFTTKQDRRNAGLGLAISYNIIAQHGGQITAESHPGEGSTFRIFLPVAEQREPSISGND